MSTSWRVRLFGDVTLQNDAGDNVRLPGRKIGTLLACLAYFAPVPIARERLMEMLWPETDLDSQRNRLSLTLSALRKLIEPNGMAGSVLLADRAYVRLNPALVSTDVADFDRLTSQAAKAETPQARLQCLEETVALYRGPLLLDVDADWVMGERAKRAEQFAQTSRALAGLLKADGRAEQAVAVLRRLLAEEPLHEEAHRDLLGLLVATGRSADAVRHFREVERTLDAELGIAPAAATRKLLEGAGAGGSEGGAEWVERLHVNTATSRVAAPSSRVSHRWLTVLASVASAAAAILLLAIVVRFSNHHVSLNPTGALLGTVRYAPLADEKDSEPTAVVTDAIGNIYVTGFVQTSSSDIDFLTLKYTPDSRLAWRKRFNGSGNDCDRAYAVEVDGAGNAYVAGESYNGDRNKGGTQWDMTLVKYAPGGKELWHRNYNGPPNDDDRAIKVCLDGAGDVYVGGWSRTPSNVYSFVVVKYTPDGERLWVRPFLPATGPGSVIDAQPFDMAVDVRGNVYITGEARIAGLPGEQSRLGFLTLRYDKRGNLIWHKVYGGDSVMEAHARKVALLKGGGAYVGGYGVNTRDVRIRAVKNFVIVCYDSQGEEKDVTARVDSAGAKLDGASDFTGGMAVDGEGRIAVTGHKPDYTYMVAEFNRQGRVAWEIRFGNPTSPVSYYRRDLAIDRAGYVCCTSFTNALPKGSSHIVTLKYAPDGANQWCRYYQAAVPGQSEGIALTLDRADNVIVAGRSFGGRTNDIVVLKYSP